MVPAGAGAYAWPENWRWKYLLTRGAEWIRWHGFAGHIPLEIGNRRPVQRRPHFASRLLCAVGANLNALVGFGHHGFEFAEHPFPYHL